MQAARSAEHRFSANSNNGVHIVALQIGFAIAVPLETGADTIKICIQKQAKKAYIPFLNLLFFKIISYLKS